MVNSLSIYAQSELLDQSKCAWRVKIDELCLARGLK